MVCVHMVSVVQPVINNSNKSAEINWMLYNSIQNKQYRTATNIGQYTACKPSGHQKNVVPFAQPIIASQKKLISTLNQSVKRNNGF